MSPAAAAVKVFVVGVLAVMASCVPLGDAVMQLRAGHAETAVDLSAQGGPLSLKLRADELARIAVMTDPRNTDPAGVPLTLMVTNSAGGRIAEYHLEAQAAALQTLESGLQARRLRSFRVPADGVVRLQPGHVDPAPSARHVQLVIEHGIHDPTVVVVVGIFLFVVGWMITIVGAQRCIAARNPLAASDTAATDADRHCAAACHLGGLAGFVIPLAGNVLGPLLLWQRYRHRHSSIDRAGVAALNFQLSLLAWLLLGFSLILLLIGVLMVPALYLLQVVATVAAVRAARKGAVYDYPLTFRFVH